MGVPVITLAGRCHAHNVSVSLLTAIGLEDQWVAQDAEQYVQLAIRHASNVPALQVLRGKLRQEMLASQLCDAAPFVAHLEDLYQGLWQRWVQEGGRVKPLLGMPGTQGLLQRQQQQPQMQELSLDGSSNQDSAAAAEDDAQVLLGQQRGSSGSSSAGKSRRSGGRSRSGGSNGKQQAGDGSSGGSDDPAVPNGQQQPSGAAAVGGSDAGAAVVDSTTSSSSLQKSRKLSSSCDAAATVHSAVAAAAALDVRDVDDTQQLLDCQPPQLATAVVQA